MIPPELWPPHPGTFLSASIQYKKKEHLHLPLLPLPPPLSTTESSVSSSWVGLSDLLADIAPPLLPLVPKHLVLVPRYRMERSAALIPTMAPLFLLVSLLPGLAMAGHDYKQALSKSILFFEAQRSGVLPSTQRVSWRANSGLGDGKASGVRLCLSPLTPAALKCDACSGCFLLTKMSLYSLLVHVGKLTARLDDVYLL